ncbi:MAG: hypothetical protein ACRDH7_09400 [Actinomycetota bacterium]
MISRPRTIAILLGAAAAAAAAVVVMRHGHSALGRTAPGGILIGDARIYDALSHRLLLGSLFDAVGADVASVAPEGGCSSLAAVPADSRSFWLADTAST